MTPKELIEMLKPYEKDNRALVLWIDTECGTMTAYTGLNIDGGTNQHLIYIQSRRQDREKEAAND